MHGLSYIRQTLSSIIIFSSLSESRGRESLINYAKIVGSEVISIYEKTFGVPKEFGRLA